MRQRLALLLLLLTASHSGRAEAQSNATSGIRTAGCPVSFAAELEYFISVELGALMQDNVTAEVRISCNGRDVAALTVAFFFACTCTVFAA